MTKKLSPPSINFEASLSELEMMIEKMEKGQLTLEESLKCFEKGVSLTRECQKALREAEQKIQVLIEQNGVIKAEPFLVEQE